ncbi:unnamed protein product, partial [marine sediment metagenome]
MDIFGIRKRRRIKRDFQELHRAKVIEVCSGTGCFVIETLMHLLEIKLAPPLEPEDCRNREWDVGYGYRCDLHDEKTKYIEELLIELGFEEF